MPLKHLPCGSSAVDRVAPDVVVEVVVPSALAEDVMGRALQDLDGGTKLVCHIFPRHHLAYLHLGAEQIKIVPLDGHTFESLGWVRRALPGHP